MAYRWNPYSQCNAAAKSTDNNAPQVQKNHHCNPQQHQQDNWSIAPYPRHDPNQPTEFQAGQWQQQQQQQQSNQQGQHHETKQLPMPNYHHFSSTVKGTEMRSASAASPNIVVASVASRRSSFQSHTSAAWQQPQLSQQSYQQDGYTSQTQSASSSSYHAVSSFKYQQQENQQQQYPHYPYPTFDSNFPQHAQLLPQQEHVVVVSGQGNQESLGAKWVCYIRSCENDELIRQVVARAEPQTQLSMLDSIFAELSSDAAGLDANKQPASITTQTSTLTIKADPRTGALLKAPSTSHSRHSFHSLCVKDRGNVVVHLLESWGANPENFEEQRKDESEEGDVEQQEEEEDLISEEATTTSITTTAMTTTTVEGETITTETTTTTTTVAKSLTPAPPVTAAPLLTAADAMLALVDHPEDPADATTTPSAPSSSPTPKGIDYYLQCELAMRHYWSELTVSQYGAIALTRLFQTLPASPYQERLAHLTLQTATPLALHQFGNFMVSEVLKTAGQQPTQFGFVFDTISKVWSQPDTFSLLAESRFGSHCLETFLRLAPAAFIHQLCEPLFTTSRGVEVCVRAARHRQGNYAMQALLKAISRGGRLIHDGGEAWVERNPCIQPQRQTVTSPCIVCLCCATTAQDLEDLRLVAKAAILPQLKKTTYVKNMVRALRTVPTSAKQPLLGEQGRGTPPLRSVDDGDEEM